nr:MAG TPA: hypothetical protein [Bacteriophage sp.]
MMLGNSNSHDRCTSVFCMSKLYIVRGADQHYQSALL